MPELKKIYSYLGNLEKKIKIALTGFVFLLFFGSFVIGVGLNKLFNYTESTNPELLVLIGLGALAIILSLMYSINKIRRIEDLHIRLDQHIFGFLKRTNDTIFESLLRALKPEERGFVDKLEAIKRRAVVQSIFSALSNDTDLFENFMKTKIFRNWTFYWTMVYGTLTYSLLTVVSFIFLMLDLDPYTKLLFTLCWLLAALHLSVVIPLGHRLVTMSKRVVDAMVESHKQQIAKMLRTNMYEEDDDDEIEEADIISDE